jgi:calcineurin-like phosphoesterase family protein
MSKIWLSSDFHLNHANITGPSITNWKSGYRNFDNVDHMTTTIINNINDHIAEDDTLWFHGDFCFGGHFRTPEFRQMINCKNIHIIRGNHDHHITKYRDQFSSIQDYQYVSLKGLNGKKYPFIMSHYAFRVWMGSHKGFYHTYGHSHSSLENSPNGKSMDVGIDNAFKIFGKYRPFQLEEVVEILDKREIAFNDHHVAETNV